MRSWLTFVLSIAIGGTAFAQGGDPPADPPKDPPKEGDPAKPDDDPEKDLEASATHWAKSWRQARSLAAKRNGYAFLWVTEERNGKGEPSFYTQRLLGQFFSNPAFLLKMNTDFGPFRGTLSELQKNGDTSAKLAEAGVSTAPAFIFIDPDDGKIVDVTVDKLTQFELEELVKIVLSGRHRKGLEDRMQDKNFRADEMFHLDYAQALFRAQEWKEARKHYEEVAKSQDMRRGITAQIGLVFCDLKEAKYDSVIRKSQEIFDRLPVDASPPRAACLYAQVWAYHHQGKPEEASKVALMLRERFIRTTHGWKLMDEQMDMKYDFIKMEKIPEVGENPPEENPK
ncbi:MAG: hypothetical protein HYY18_07675 [Planctomycetes bacterium]|nr:hypothetical protein [Planctomycetota bacterium]